MADVLKQCGFEVKLLTDAGLRTMENQVREFTGSLEPGGVGLFYFSGHGMQVNGINYLLPTDVDILKESEVKNKSMSANFILEQMDQAGNTMNILILDAFCPQFPFFCQWAGFYGCP